MGKYEIPTKNPEKLLNFVPYNPTQPPTDPLIAIILLSVHYRAIISTLMKRKGHKICTHGLLPS